MKVAEEDPSTPSGPEIPSRLSLFRCRAEFCQNVKLLLTKNKAVLCTQKCMYPLYQKKLEFIN